MLLRRLATSLLFVAIAGSAASRAISTEASKTRPATKTDGGITRAPVAKAFKTKSKGHKSHFSSKTSSKTASTKSLSTTPTPSATASAIHPTKHPTTTASLRPATLTSLGSREAITARVMHSLANTKLGIENPRALQPFFDQLHQLEADPGSQLVRVIQ